MIPHRNIELKARCPDLAKAAQTLTILGARHAAELDQLDTYFHVKTGRLKLREITDTNTLQSRSELIWYERPDTPTLRQSHYHITPIPDPAATKALLAAALGIQTQVQKHRTLYLYHNIRIHLDRVRSQGHFIEFEAVLITPNDEEQSPHRLNHLIHSLNIHDQNRLSTSYADLP